MGIENLLGKSNDNLKTAIWAEKQSFYDSAISRYYYSLYTKMIYILKKKGFYKKPPKGEDSHIYTIKLFNENLSNSLTPTDIATFSAMSKLKKARVKSEYEESKINDSNDFNLSFKFSFNCINEVLDKLI